MHGTCLSRQVALAKLRINPLQDDLPYVNELSGHLLGLESESRSTRSKSVACCARPSRASGMVQLSYCATRNRYEQRRGKTPSLP